MGKIDITRRGALIGAAAAFSAASSSGWARSEASPAADLVILTVGGLIESANRPPFEAARDKFFDHANLRFERARAFRLSELASLPQHDVISHEVSGEITFTGPLLWDVLALASPKPMAKTLRLSALDGYAAEIAMADLAPQQWIIGMKAGGQPLEIGGYGPLRVMRNVSAEEARSDEEIKKWVYALFYIEVMG